MVCTACMLLLYAAAEKQRQKLDQQARSPLFPHRYWVPLAYLRGIEVELLRLEQQADALEEGRRTHAELKRRLHEEKLERQRLQDRLRHQQQQGVRNKSPLFFHRYYTYNR
eukprot:COSAG05_NODE_416_length_10031_cov_18.951067_8_plen_111_part_00